MKKYLFLLLLTASAAMAQTGTANNAKYKMQTPVLGAAADSVVVWNGTDKFLKFRPASVFGGSQNLQQTLENGNEAELDIKFPFDSGLGTVFDGENRRFGFIITDVPRMVDLNKDENIFTSLGLYNSYLELYTQNTEFTGFKGNEEFDFTGLSDDRKYFTQKGYVDDAIAAAGGGGATNLSYTLSPTDGTVNSDTGTDATIPLADGTNAGLLSPAMKTKVDGIASGATANTGTVTTVSVVTANGVTGSVANASTTPAITLSLGAITPTTVVASGNVTAPNIDSTNKTDIAAKAPIASPTFTGTVSIPSTGLSISGSLGNAYFLRGDGSQSPGPFVNTVQNSVMVGTDNGANATITGLMSVRNAFWNLQKQVDNVLTNAPFSAVNSTTVALTKAALNTAYPNAPIGFVVQASAITTGAMVYIKNSEAGSSDVWLSIVATVTP